MTSSDQTANSGSRRRRQRMWLGLIGGAALTGALGLAGIFWPLTQTLDRWSFDLPFLWRFPMQTDEFVIVHMDAASGAELGQPLGRPWDRRLHAQLIDRLTQEGARLIVYDVMFLTPAADAAADDALEESLRRSDRVILAGGQRRVMTVLEGTNRAYRLQPLAPLRRFREAALGWGTATVSAEMERGAFIRQIPRGDANMPDVVPLAIAAKRALTGIEDPTGSASERWINYVGPPGVWNVHTFSRALSQPAHYASNRIVLVGAWPETGFFEEDQFATPYTRFGHRLTPGVELQATMLSNLVRRDWITRASLSMQAGLVLLFGLVLGAGCVTLNPRRSAVFCLGLIAVVSVVSVLVVWNHNVWWSWLVPVAMQAPVAFAWGLGYRYFVVDQRSRRLKQAFGAYLSPVMADQLAEQDELLALGGREVEVTVMFTDLEGFTAMSESLPPAEVSRILIEYFNRTTRGILAENGTIIKYIGDAVMAVWSAPIDDPDHALHAVTAACVMSRAGKEAIAGRMLRTRIGLNTGMVLAGNLGSQFRFDYTLIGDAVNFASRLEGLNKQLETDILISESTASRVRDHFALRDLGRFIVVGKKQSVRIYEVLGPVEALRSAPEWMNRFDAGLAAWVTKDLAAAETLFREVMAARGGMDGPSAFYLDAIARVRSDGTGEDPWTGEVKLTGK